MRVGSRVLVRHFEALLLLFILLDIVRPAASHLTKHTREEIQKQCKEEILKRADCRKLKHKETKQQCMNDCICEKEGLLTKDGEMASTPPQKMDLDPEAYQIKRMKCNKLVHNAPYCEKALVMEECMRD
ncbi:hypothetical protein R5R35_008816 [Gryllus longicercus]|uniref:Odorant binding protein n=1 Tax=Gryllus longicercus TaxID=2509291 RepID=A0AAN9YYF2_9ORTH